SLLPHRNGFARSPIHQSLQTSPAGLRGLHPHTPTKAASGLLSPLPTNMPRAAQVGGAIALSTPRKIRVSAKVRPVNASVFSRRQTCRGKSQEPRSLDSRVAGNQDSEAYRQGLPWGDPRITGP